TECASCRYLPLPPAAPVDRHTTRKTEQLRATLDGDSIAAAPSTKNTLKGSFSELPPGVGPRYSDTAPGGVVHGATRTHNGLQVAGPRRTRYAYDSHSPPRSGFRGTTHHRAPRGRVSRHRLRRTVAAGATLHSLRQELLPADRECRPDGL